MSAAKSHIESLDGIRGLAIAMVFLLHTILLPADGYQAMKAFLSLGHLGVDLFFVLSGFLITGILFAAKASPNYFRNFYARRSLRIFPLYYLFLIGFYFAVVDFHVVSFGAAKAQEAARDLHWAWFYGTNIEIAKTGDFITASLNQFWTLAVEEHFYLFWPLLIFWLSLRGILMGAAIMCVGSLALRIALAMHGVHPHVILSLTPCRIDSFAIGDALSLILMEGHGRALTRKCAPITAMASLILLLVCFFSRNDYLFETVGFTITSVFFASLIACCVLNEKSKLSGFFSARLPRFFGKYSYALYVLHFPVLIFVSRKIPMETLASRMHSVVLASASISILVGAISICLALATWNLFEKHFLLLKRYWEPKLVGVEEFGRGSCAAPIKPRG